MAAQAEPKLRGPDQLERLGELSRDHEDFRAALRVEDKHGTASVLADLSIAAAGHGDDDRARRCREESLSALRDLGHKPGVAEGSYELARIATAEGQLEQAEGLLVESLVVCREIGHEAGAALALIELGGVVESAGDPARAVTLWGAADRQLEECDVAALLVQWLTNQQIADGLVVALKTVEGHVTNILSKLGFERRAQVAAWAVANCLAEAPPDLDTLLGQS